MTRRGPLRRLRSRMRDAEGGQVTVMMGLLMMVGLGFAGLAIDAGNVYLHQKRLKSAVDLALVSAAQKLPNTSTATSDLRGYVNTNWQKTDDGEPATDVTTGCVTSGCLQPDKISASATANVKTTFAKLFGVGNFTVKAKGAACGPCDASPEKFDVMVVLDRSWSMCRDANNNINGAISGPATIGNPHGITCPDLVNAKEGIRALLGPFDPALDRIGFAVLSSGDNVSPFDHTFTYNSQTINYAYPCDAGSPTGTSGKGTFYRSTGDFMDGTAASHDAWVVSPLKFDYKNADKSLNESSQLLSTLSCLRPKGWTPMAPAVKEATDHLLANPRADTKKIMVFMGDGGGNVQPMKRDADGNALTTNSWYTATSGNHLKPCADAVAQAQRAKDNGIDVYTIGYDLNSGASNTCYRGNRPSDSNYVETGINARETLSRMASGSSFFFEKASAGEVGTIFRSIARKIKGNSVRLIE